MHDSDRNEASVSISIHRESEDSHPLYEHSCNTAVGTAIRVADASLTSKGLQC